MARVLTARYRWSVASRVAAALVGGYGFTWLFTATLGLLLHQTVRMPKVDAVLVATMTGFVAYPALVVAIFTARSAARVWAGLIAAAAITALVLAGIA